MPPNNGLDQSELRKLLKNICKLQDDQAKAQDIEHSILETRLEQMNKLLAELNSIMGTNVNIARGESQTFNIPLDVRHFPNGTYTVCADGICKAISVAISAPIGNINVTSSPSGSSIWNDETKNRRH